MRRAQRRSAWFAFVGASRLFRYLSDCHVSSHKSHKSHKTTESPWRSTSTSPQKLKEFKIRSIGFSRKIQKDLSNHSINDLTLLKRKENANDCTTSTWQGPSKTAEPSLAVNKRQRKEQQCEGIEEFDYAVDPETGWMFCKESRRNLPTASSSSSNWDRTQWKTSNWNSSAFFKA